MKTNRNTTIDTAKVDIEWDAQAVDCMYHAPDGTIRSVPNKKVLIRTDNNNPLGIVGNKYTIYQNSKMWEFIENFNKVYSSKVDMMAELRGGSVVAVALKGDSKEYIKNDEIYSYFVFKNSFDGSSPLSVLFTNMRIVCENTLNAAFKNGVNGNDKYTIRHVSTAEERMEEIETILNIHKIHQEMFDEAMEFLVKSTIPNTFEAEKLLKSIVFPKKSDSKKAVTQREKNINKVLELMETGKGTDIPGVVGTRYGLYQAYTEWADHYKSVKVPTNRDEAEIRFEAKMFAASAKEKARVLNDLLKT